MDEATQLALAARDGDDDALAQLIRLTQADVWRFCAHLTDADHADDLTQDVYARALRSLASFRGDAPARTWLLAIARRTWADAVRSATRRRRLADQLQRDGERRARELRGDPAGLHDLNDIVAQLPDDYRLAFVLTQVLGLSYAETASVCDCPVGTVRSRVARARESLVLAVQSADDEARAQDGRRDC